MSGAQLLLIGILLAALVCQAALPQARLLIITLAAAVAGACATGLGVTSTRELLAEVPWGVLVMLVGLGLLAEMLAASRLFGVLAAQAARFGEGNPRLLLAGLSAGMFLVSGLVNNLTALVLVLPPVLVLLQLMGADRRYAVWLLGCLLVACNLGGAATPIGDFPAILLLGNGSLDFGNYLVHALPAAGLAMIALLLVVDVAVRPARGMADDGLSRRLSTAVMGGLYRRVRIDTRILVPAAIMLLAMVAAWTSIPQSSGVTPDLVCWLGVIVALLSRARLGERLVRTRVDVEATLFLLSLFIMVGAVRHTGIFADISLWLTGLELAGPAKLAVFITVAALLTGVFSAGPSMAALLEVAPALTATMPRTAVYVGLAMGVCAGSSLFLTAATSGPLAQAMTERAGIVTADGRPLRFGFAEFLPIGLLAFVLILGAGIAAALFISSTAAQTGVP
ncbi:MAG: permease [Planctomycetes bacterium]|nr:permease [Planctomycetota bacterium]